MLSPYRGRGFYDPLSEMNRLFAQVFGLTPTRAHQTNEQSRDHALPRRSQPGLQP